MIIDIFNFLINDSYYMIHRLENERRILSFWVMNWFIHC